MVSSINASVAVAMNPTAAAGQIEDPAARQAQVNAQADLLQATRGMELPLKLVAARVSDNQGVDLYM